SGFLERTPKPAPTLQQPTGLPSLPLQSRVTVRAQPRRLEDLARGGPARAMLPNLPGVRVFESRLLARARVGTALDSENRERRFPSAQPIASGPIQVPPLAPAQSSAPIPSDGARTNCRSAAADSNLIRAAADWKPTPGN